MGRASDPQAQFRRAVEYRRFDDALQMARHLPVSLENAARLTMLAAEVGSPRFEPMAFRLISLLMEHRHVSLAQLTWLAACFRDAGEGHADESLRAVLRFIRQQCPVPRRTEIRGGP